MQLLCALLGGGSHHHRRPPPPPPRPCYGGYGYGGGPPPMAFGYGGPSRPMGHGGYGGGGHHHHGGGGGFGFGGPPCGRMSYGGGYGGGGYGGGGMRYRSLEGEGGGAESSAAPPPNAPPLVEASQLPYYRGEVAPIIPYATPSVYTGGNVKALFIGINYTGTPTELKGSCADVGVMIESLKHIQFPLKEAAILVDDPNFAGANGVPTRDAILQHMLWLVDGAKAGDVLFFHYSGHSSNTVGADGTPNGSQTLVPSDYATAGMIVDDDIYEILIRNLPIGVRMTIIIDSSVGAGMVDLPFAYTLAPESAAKYGRHMTADEACGTHMVHSDVVMLCGVGATNEGSGACTNALSVVLRETAGLDYAGLMEAMKGQLEKHGIAQIPRVSCTKPMNLRSPFSLFGVPADDTHYYRTGSTDTMEEWRGVPANVPKPVDIPPPVYA